MKRPDLLLALVATAVTALGQGELTFQNRAVGVVVAPIYDVDPADPSRMRRGNTPAGVPADHIDYQGIPLVSGPGYTAQLWAGPLGSSEAQLQLCGGGATTTFRTGSAAGFVVEPATAAIVIGVPGGPGTRAAFQVRAWNNLGGTITGWDQIMANPMIPHGSSHVVQGGFDLGGGSTLRNVALPGLTSFNLYVVPEPSLLGWGVLGLVGRLLRRRRCQRLQL